jgi:hypothetical protein
VRHSKAAEGEDEPRDGYPSALGGLLKSSSRSGGMRQNRRFGDCTLNRGGIPSH